MNLLGIHAMGGLITRPEFAIIGEGGRPEAVIPTDNQGMIPLVMTNQGIKALLPGGRTIGTTFTKFANGGLTSGSLNSPMQMPGSFTSNPMNLTIVNVYDPAQIVKLGLGANTGSVVNMVANDIRNAGVVRKANERFNRR